MAIAEKHTSRLDEIKKNVTNSYEFFRDNYRNFSNWMRFIFVTSITADEEAVNRSLDRPKMEFNIMEPYISRQLGEFASNEPSVFIQPQPGFDTPQQTIDLLQNHFLHMLFEAERDGIQFENYKNVLVGFGAMDVYTEYVGRSFQQEVRIDIPHYPALCFWDPSAKLVHKGDGRYCGKWYPMPWEQFKSDYPKADKDKYSFIRSVNSNEFNWSYKNGQQEFVMVCDYYEKKQKPVNIIELSNGEVIRKDKYQDYVNQWQASGRIEQAPIPKKGRERWVDDTIICRYRFTENEILEYTETLFNKLPIVFFDGNSAKCMDPNTGAYQQVTRSYCHNVQGAQQLKNLAGQMIANDLETSVQHKFMVMKEAIPNDGASELAYQNVQKADVLVYNGFDPNDSSKPLAPPTVCPRAPMPPEFLATFTMADQLMQTILGNYDAAMGINDNDLSGKAMLQAQNQSNTVSTPTLKNYMTSLSQVFNVIADVIPKIYTDEYTIPLRTPEGNQSYSVINQKGQKTFDYEPNALKVQIKASANYNAQKVMTIQQMSAMMGANPLWGQFVAQYCGDLMINNMNCLNQQELKRRWQAFSQQIFQQQQMAQQQAQQQPPNPAAIRAQVDMAKLQQEAQQNQIKNQLDAAQLQIDKQKVDVQQMQVLADMRAAQTEAAVRVDQASAEKARAAADLAMKSADISHSHAMDMLNLHQQQIEHKDNNVRKNVEN